MTGLSQSEVTMPKQTFHNLPEDKRALIVEAAMKEFSKHPYEYASINAVVRETGISRGSFYQYFEGKPDLFTHVITIIGVDKARMYGPLIDPSVDMPFLERYHQMLVGALPFAKAHPTYVAIARQIEASSDPFIIRMKEDNNRRAADLFEPMIRTDIAKGRLRPDLDPAFFARLVTDTMATLMAGKYMTDGLDIPALETHIGQLVNIFRKGTTHHV
jgi:AcrR family transcriptional regulator